MTRSESESESKSKIASFLCSFLVSHNTTVYCSNCLLKQSCQKGTYINYENKKTSNLKTDIQKSGTNLWIKDGQNDVDNQVVYIFC